MLPTAAAFDALLEKMPDLDNRIACLVSVRRQVAELSERVGRATALLSLEMHEREHSYQVVAHRLGVTRSRAAQLVADGKLWRQHENGT